MCNGHEKRQRNNLQQMMHERRKSPDMSWWNIFFTSNSRLFIDGLVQDCSNSIANALELLQSCTKLSIYTGPTSWYRCDCRCPSTYLGHLQAQWWRWTSFSLVSWVMNISYYLSFTKWRYIKQSTRSRAISWHLKCKYISIAKASEWATSQFNPYTSGSFFQIVISFSHVIHHK